MPGMVLPGAHVQKLSGRSLYVMKLVGLWPCIKPCTIYQVQQSCQAAGLVSMPPCGHVMAAAQTPCVLLLGRQGPGEY